MKKKAPHIYLMELNAHIHETLEAMLFRGPNVAAEEAIRDLQEHYGPEEPAFSPSDLYSLPMGLTAIGELDDMLRADCANLYAHVFTLYTAKNDGRGC